jgi:prophage regulatory protein
VDSIISKKKLLQIIGLSDSQLRRLEKAGKFPKRVWLGPGRVGWIGSEVNAWIDALKAARDCE